MSLATITEPIAVTVVDMKQITEDLAVLSFLTGSERKDNLFNVRSPEVMDTLRLVPAGKKVVATLAPNGGQDNNGHPDCTGAVVEDTATEASAQ